MTNEEIYMTVCRLKSRCDMDICDIVEALFNDVNEYFHLTRTGTRRYIWGVEAVKIILSCEKSNQREAALLESSMSTRPMSQYYQEILSLKA